MREIIIGANDAGRRLDRFLRKYLREASLGEIYKLIRKDVKVDGRRRDQAYMLSEGEILSLYLSDDVLDRMTGTVSSAGAACGRRNGAASGRSSARRARRQFGIIYEDDNILIVNKPFGLLTHGDSYEKKAHLANQVKDYLIEKGDYDPRAEKIFSPAPANRIDRNTTGIVLFGKTAAALKDLNTMIREDLLDKYYLTIASGIIEQELTLTGSLVKDESSNRVAVSEISEDPSPAAIDRAGHRWPSAVSAADAEHTAHSRGIVTVVRPLECFRVDTGRGIATATLAEVRLVTGRPHQIRAHLAGIGHPVMGDAKYAVRSAAALNDYAKRRFGLTTQLLHAQRIEFSGMTGGLGYLQGRVFEAPLPDRFEKILGALASPARTRQQYKK